MRCMWLLQEEGAESVLVGDGSVDYQGRPANRRKTGGWRSTPYIFCKLYSTLQTPSFQWLNLPISLPESLVNWCAVCLPASNSQLGTYSESRFRGIYYAVDCNNHNKGLTLLCTAFQLCTVHCVCDLFSRFLRDAKFGALIWEIYFREIFNLAQEWMKNFIYVPVGERARFLIKCEIVW